MMAAMFVEMSPPIRHSLCKLFLIMKRIATKNPSDDIKKQMAIVMIPVLFGEQGLFQSDQEIENDANVILF